MNTSPNSRDKKERGFPRTNRVPFRTAQRGGSPTPSRQTNGGKRPFSERPTRSAGSVRSSASWNGERPRRDASSFIRTAHSSPAQRPAGASRGASAPFRGTRPRSVARPNTQRLYSSSSAPQRQQPQYGTSRDKTTSPRTPRANSKFTNTAFAPKKRTVVQKPPRTRSASFHRPAAEESWGNVAEWYHEHLESTDTYHRQVLLPHLLRLVDPKKGDDILDLACGEGFFARGFHEKGATVTGVDVSPELVKIAKDASPEITYVVHDAAHLDSIKKSSADQVTIVLALQNIEHIQDVFTEVSRVLRKEGTFHIVLNHPAFRIPKSSSWEFDEKRKTQYRRVDAYLSETRSEMDMHPGIPDSAKTLSFHRPLQFYFKGLLKAGFTVNRLEEWISHKTSDSGPRATAENIARKEIPLFLYLSAKKS